MTCVYHINQSSESQFQDLTALNMSEQHNRPGTSFGSVSVAEPNTPFSSTFASAARMSVSSPPSPQMLLYQSFSTLQDSMETVSFEVRNNEDPQLSSQPFLSSEISGFPNNFANAPTTPSWAALPPPAIGSSFGEPSISSPLDDLDPHQVLSSFSSYGGTNPVAMNSSPGTSSTLDNRAFNVRLDDSVVDSIISRCLESFGYEDQSDNPNCLHLSEISLSSPDSPPQPQQIPPTSRLYSEPFFPRHLPSRDTPSTSSHPSGPQVSPLLMCNNFPKWGEENSNLRVESSQCDSQSVSERGEDWGTSSEKAALENCKESRVKKKVKSTRARAKRWTAEEHKRFEESLELYGRNWEQCARYIGTRRASLVRSHAQKHLIKLWKLGKPLPKKLAETGSGYTLSGRPLLADSASAKSYLIKLPCPESGDGNKSAWFRGVIYR